jgi:predicted membrane-bound spermidine synthase
MDRVGSRGLQAVFFATGFSALTLQVVWQRMIALHNGVDLVSFTTVVSAFLAGLGVGGGLGGVLADRLGPRRCLVAFATANVGIALFAAASQALFYDLYRDVRPSLGGTAASFGFNVALLLVPTTLMGLSLPLLARATVVDVAEAGALVGRLYAVNTLGAAFGAATAGWFLLGTLGFSTAARFAGALNLLAAVASWVIAHRRDAAAATDTASADVSDDAPVTVAAAAGESASVWPWFVVYGLTGAVALGFETVFFRVVDALMRSNSYSFPHVLSLYLLLFGAGTAVGSRRVRRVARPDRWFVGIQVAVGLSAALCLLLLTRVAPALGGKGVLRSYFDSDNFNIGFSNVDGATGWAKLAFAYLVGPLTVLAVPVFLMGAAYPFVQAIVSQRLDTLGRHTGTLFACNIVGNVAGTLLVGFVLLDRIGTIGTVRVLTAVLLAIGVFGVVRLAEPSERLRAAGVLGAGALVLAALPSNQSFWAFFHGADDDQVELVEERACVDTTKDVAGSRMLFVNASSQNPHPYEDFHLLIGLTPALTHPDPKKALVIGLSVGSTPYSVTLDPRLEQIDTVEICGGQVELLRRMAAEGRSEPAALLADERVRIHEDDGRDWMLGTDDRFDVVVIDVLRQQSAYSGNVYSVEFYKLVSEHLAKGGIFAQWIPTGRTYNSAVAAFPYVQSFGDFLIASNDPISFDRAAVRQRLAGSAGAGLSAEQRASIDRYYERAPLYCARAGGPPPDLPADLLNRDLHARDEYFLNNEPDVPLVAAC